MCASENTIKRNVKWLGKKLCGGNMDSNDIVDTARLVRLKRLTATNNGNHLVAQSANENIACANDTKVIYRNFSGRPDIYDDNEYYLSSNNANEKFGDFKRRTNARRATSALPDDDDILTDAVEIDAFQLPNKLWDEKIPNTKDGFIL